MNMKSILTPLLFLSLTACSILDNKNIAPGYVEAYKSIKSLFINGENYQITPSIVNNIPYASSLFKIGRGPTGLIILESKRYNINTWVSADGVYIVVKDGKIIQTSGLKNNLIDYVSPLKDINYLSFKEKFLFTSYYSYDSPVLNNLQVKSSIKIIGEEEVQLLNKTIILTLVEETVDNTYLGWSVINKYWVDNQNFVWKTIQHISPKLPPFFIEVTKKPAK